MNRKINKIFSVMTILALMLMTLPMQSVQAVSTDIVISEFRTRGPSGGNDEFIELYNLSTSPVNIGGWKIKGSNNTGGGTTTPRATIPVNTILNPGCHYLLTNSTSPAYSGSVPGNQPYGTGVTDDGGIAITTAADVIVDQVGMHTGSAFKEGTVLIPLTTNVNRGYERKPGGASGSGTDTDNNSTDFQLITPSDPQNSSSTCVGGGGTPNLSISDFSANEGNAGTTTFSFTVSLSSPAGPGGVTFDIATADGTAQDDNPATEDNDYVAQSLTGQPIPAGNSTYTFDVSVNGDTTTEPNETFFVNVSNVVGANVTDDQGQGTIVNDEPTPIHDIQGATHISSRNGQIVTTTSAIVTALRTAGSTRGFYIQDISPDADDATSEGIFVFTGSTSNPTTLAAVGNIVQVSGTVSEFRPASTSLTITELVGPLTVNTISTGNPLPTPVTIGAGGRTPPTTVIEDDATGDVETSGVFDPTSDGIDFYESLEGMLVQVNDAVATGPTSDFGSNREISVVVDNGANAGVRTARGGIVIQSSDFNPERVILNDLIAGGPTLPPVDVGDSYPGATVGVIDYSFGNFKLEVISLPALSANGLAPEATTSAAANQLAVATFNVENLAPGDPASKYNTLAAIIINNLQAPDILAIEEIQDNNGTVNDGTVDASQTWGALIAAIQSAGGPTYDYRQIDPVNGQDGGAPGGNIRVGFLFRTDRGLSFIDRPGGGSTTPTTVVSGPNGPELSASPGRVNPTNSAFNASRKPLAGEFLFNGRHLFVIANHFNSKGGDQPLFGHFQPPTRGTEVQRHQQADILHDFVQSIVAVDPNADVIVLGDINDFEFSQTMNILETGTPAGPAILNDLMSTLPQDQRYSYVFEGNSQSLDHIVLSNNLFGAQFEYDVVHVNSEFAPQASDHDPQVVQLLTYDFNGFFQPVDNLPTFNTVKAGQSIPIRFSLSGDQGLNIFAAGYPKSETIACNSNAPADGVEETLTAGNSSLSYDPTTDTYTYAWKTNKGWANTCRQLILKLADGTFHRANFNFTK